LFQDLTRRPKAADLLYEVINRRYERKSVIVTTNRPFKEWNEVFPNATCIATLLDRLLHHADVTVIEGDSYRIPASQQETAARRRKKCLPRRRPTPIRPIMWPPCSFCMSNCRRRLCVPVFRINGRLNVYMIAEFPCAWLSPPSCWHHRAGWPGP